MIAKELRKKYLDFFVGKGHQVVPSASLIPENDPTTLFISAGMQPLIPFLLGEVHPLDKRICSVQKCLRTVDIDNVGDSFHHTFLEMLGNWSLGDYWKEEAISWSFEFLTEYLKINPEKLSVTCFAGDQDAPKDEESAGIWRKLGIPVERIYFLSKEDNWWGPAGVTGPCGPDSEMFYDTGKEKCGSNCRPGCGCGKYFEIWNNVFMQYNKTAEGKFELLKQKNVDTGMGVERTISVLNGLDDDYQNELFAPIIAQIEEISKKKYLDEENKKPMRVIADHLRAASFLIADGVVPSNTDQGYILRRLIRRAIRHGRALHLHELFTAKVAESVIKKMSDVYPELLAEKQLIVEELSKEEEKFLKTIEEGLNFLNKEVKAYQFFENAAANEGRKLPYHGGRLGFDMYQTYGFPPEMTLEELKRIGVKIDDQVYWKGYQEKFDKHQQKSRIGAEKKFAGGLADHSEQVVKYHTATHLLHAALRKVLGEQVHQIGSNLTAERLRFDFTYPERVSDEQLKQVEGLVNQQIKADVPVVMEVMELDEARKQGALAFFEQKYGEKVKVYTIGGFSKEVCGGPHVKSTGEISQIEIFKEEAVGAGKRRIYARIK